jgi:TonB family protein
MPRLNCAFPSQAWRLPLCLMCLISSFFSPPLWPQELSRRVISRAIPAVPPLAKKLHLTGRVKLEVIVAPNGSVTSARPVGGSPVFEQSAVAAVRKWKFERSAKETKGVVVIDFTAD